MGFSNCGLIRFKDDLCAVSVHVQGSENEDQTGERCVRRNSLQPIIVQIKQYHLRLCGFQNHVTKLLNLRDTNTALEKITIECVNTHLPKVYVNRKVRGFPDLSAAFYSNKPSNKLGKEAAAHCL